ncbi:hypothetical protein EBQ90_05865 [bacterium]|nr:hypothetical protein [bacterium]
MSTFFSSYFRLAYHSILELGVYRTTVGRANLGELFLGSFLAGTGGLTYYLIHFLKKTKGFDLLSLLFLLGILYSPSTWACSVCQFQTPDSPLVMAIREGIWILLFLVAAMIVGFFSLFLFWAKRERQTTAK